MKILIITSSPNEDGLTAACGSSAKLGAKEAGAGVVQVNLNKLSIGTCNACGNGWGPCLNEHSCQVQDDFQTLHDSLKDYAGIVIATPVYWGDMSESAKAFFDRIRRCEAWKKEEGFLQNKPVISIAAAGGSGNGAMTCLSSLERMLIHIKAERFDFISITRKTRAHKLVTIQNSVKEMINFINTK